jgi:transposase
VGYDADHLRTFIADDLGATAQIKQNPSRSGTKAIDWALYKERNLVERFFNQIKRFRRIALREDHRLLHRLRRARMRDGVARLNEDAA